MKHHRLAAIGLLIIGAALIWFVWSTQANPESPWRFKLGLDLAGGTELTYKADTASIAEASRPGALASLHQVIERRVNLFGVAEPLVQTERASTLNGQAEDRLIVDLPGVTNVKAAVDAIGKTPVLEFRLQKTVGTTTEFVSTGLTGQYLANASLEFGNGGASNVLGSPIVLLKFNDEGAKLFEKITSEHVGDILGIFLDGSPISTPVIQEAIPGGTATITGKFNATEAKSLVQNLNFGALPVPIELIGSNTAGPTLGANAITAGVLAGIVGFLLVAVFMLLWYRLPGLVADVALVGYLALVLSVMKFIPVTFTASGIAGLIISVGMAVDANVLIFERIKEELREGKGPREAAHIGFSRAWPAIRDGHLTMLISAVILFWLGTSLIQGFALVFALGVIASLVSAVTVSRIFLLAILPEANTGAWRFLTGSGLRK
ncbi:MAG: protein translocase subunit SecD [bacterium]